ncbi:TIGR02444 family protein [Pseudomonas stutzeri]|uniref:TIGR02444 family protein n=1 Tax=Stutzerimonas stutzeri TaxID=316 RepID=UPI00210E6E71|nr:TIGR02444 family protein [Stutzerimonas stutzeri]MCQ4312503.1 TIGR02444 family protein [Stutzerimonas stutzeri]
MTTDELWNFAVACYAKPGVEAACLELQTAGADVCLMLTGAWLDCRGIARDEMRLAQLKEISDVWRSQVVAPLRSLRQGWRKQAANDEELAALRERVKKLELDAERVQLQRLQHATRHWTTESRTTDWLERLCADLNGELHAPLEVLRRAANQFALGDD